MSSERRCIKWVPHGSTKHMESHMLGLCHYPKRNQNRLICSELEDGIIWYPNAHQSTNEARIDLVFMLRQFGVGKSCMFTKQKHMVGNIRGVKSQFPMFIVYIAYSYLNLYMSWNGWFWVFSPFALFCVLICFI